MLYIVCEGQTEALFVSQILDPAWLGPQAKPVTPIPLDGSLRPFARMLRQIQLLLRHPAARVTTLIDYYGMPPDFPGMPHRPLPPGNLAAVLGEVARLETALAAAVDSSRFIPHYALHEFETLAFADPAAIAAQRERLPGAKVLDQAQQMLVRALGNPELVNDTSQTSPSHRLMGLWPPDQFQKTIDSIGIVQRIPFVHLQARCAHFAAWTRQL